MLTGKTMMHSIRKLILAGGLMAGLAFGPRAFAADSAQDFVQSKQARVTSLLHESPSSQRDKQVAAVLDGMMNYEELAKRSLATHWNDLSETQRKEFTDILRRLVQRNYERNIKNILDYRVEYLGEDPASDSVVVHTRATSTTNQREDPVAIDYKLSRTGDEWKVLDIVTEGSSLVNNYKNQFHRIIQKDGYDALVKRMKDKLAKNQAV
jgi:phospholipid transport system substrate-binding protein